MESIERLRSYAEIHWEPWDASRNRLNETLDEIEQEISERFMELPVDVNGVPIRVGDKLLFCDFAVQCAAVSPERIYYWDEYSNGHWVKGVECRHCKLRTIEDVLLDAIERAAHPENEWSEIIADCADELRNMGVGE